MKDMPPWRVYELLKEAGIQVVCVWMMGTQYAGLCAMLRSLEVRSCVVFVDPGFVIGSVGFCVQPRTSY